MSDNIKIVQSLWTKPSAAKAETNLMERSLGGWPTAQHNCMSWALSCLCARALYNRVELVTDQRGYQLLVEQLALPYTHVSVTLDALDHYDSGLWALGKVFAYAQQDEPFIHIDGDVFLWEQLPERIVTAPLVAQHEEHDYSFYYDNLKGADEFGFDLPNLLKEERQHNSVVTASNAGIMGGTNVAFYKTLKTMVVDFIEQNSHKLPSPVTGCLNNLFEQYLFWCLAKQEQIPIAYLLDNISYAYEGLCDFHQVPHRQFIHVLGVNKRKMRYAEEVSLRLQRQWPEVHNRIVNIFSS